MCSQLGAWPRPRWVDLGGGGVNSGVEGDGITKQGLGYWDHFSGSQGSSVIRSLFLFFSKQGQVQEFSQRKKGGLVIGMAFCAPWGCGYLGTAQYESTAQCFGGGGTAFSPPG